MKRLTHNFVFNYFQENNCVLLEDSYINARTLMKYRCNCGEVSKITYDHFKRGRRCKECGMSRMADKQRLTYDFVKNNFEKNECELLEKIYINNGTKMKYKCVCGKISNISFLHFQDGRRCWGCAIEKRTGETSPTWNHSLTKDDRIKTRKTPENHKWRKNVFKRDDYTCKKCSKKGVYLNAHHKNGWNMFKEQRYLVSNGITLCKDCHSSFHNEYGRGNNTEWQTVEFLDEL